MSDIYLAISETPTVVTLTSAVLNSAVASSVTVTNTVTVALDANSLSALENVTVTVGAAITGTVTVGNSVTIGSLPAISGTVTAFGEDKVSGGVFYPIPLTDSGEAVMVDIRGAFGSVINVPISGTVTVGNTVTIAGTVTANPTGTQTIAGTVTAMAGTNFRTAIEEGILDYLTNDNFPVNISSPIPAGTAQIGSVTASISNSVTIGSLPAISGTVTANTFALQGTAVTTSNFTSTTASTVLANYNATRQVLTIFNEGAGNLHIAPGATCTTVQYQVRLSSGDYYEAPSHQSTITHSAVFATAGTARICQLS